jgi:hypothetical protein
MEIAENDGFNKYSEMMQKAIWEIDSDFKVNYKISPEVNTVFKKEILACGEINLQGQDNFNYKYHFILGKEQFFVADTLIMFGGRKGDFSKGLHTKIAEFNESLAKKLNCPKITVEEKSSNVRNLYESLGYKFENDNFGKKQLN